jgi:hypothetical protein
MKNPPQPQSSTFQPPTPERLEERARLFRQHALPFLERWRAPYLQFISDMEAASEREEEDPSSDGETG